MRTSSEMLCYADLDTGYIYYYSAQNGNGTNNRTYFKTGSETTYTITATLGGILEESLTYDQLSYFGITDANGIPVGMVNDSSDPEAWVREGNVIRNCTSAPLSETTLYRAVAELASDDDLVEGYTMVLTISEGSESCAE